MFHVVTIYLRDFIFQVSLMYMCFMGCLSFWISPGKKAKYGHFGVGLSCPKWLKYNSVIFPFYRWAIKTYGQRKRRLDLLHSCYFILFWGIALAKIRLTVTDWTKAAWHCIAMELRKRTDQKERVAHGQNLCQSERESAWLVEIPFPGYLHANTNSHLIRFGIVIEIRGEKRKKKNVGQDSSGWNCWKRLEKTDDVLLLLCLNEKRR